MSSPRPRLIIRDMKKYFIVSFLVALSLVLTGMANAASTIGTNMSTTGTFTQTVGSATAAKFQNAAGTTTVLVVDTTNTRVGVNKTPSVKFEVGGTASAAYLFTHNSIQVSGTTGASVAWSRFGTGAANRTAEIDSANDLYITGALEVDGKSFFDGTASVASHFEVGGTASVSGVVYLTNGQIRPGAGGDSTTAFRFQNAAGTTTVLTIDTTNNRVGVGKTPSTIFDVKGTASAAYGFFNGSLQAAGTTGVSVSYSRFGTNTTGNTGEMNAANDLLISGSLEVDGKASVASNFQTSGRFIADTAASHSFAGDLYMSGNFVAGATTASLSGGLYAAEFGGGSNTATVSILFGGSAATSKGTCFQMKDAGGNWRYVRILAGGTSFTINGTACHLGI